MTDEPVFTYPSGTKVSLRGKVVDVPRPTRWDLDRALEERQTERLREVIRELLCWFGPGSAASLGAKRETLQEALDAARAEVDGKCGWCGKPYTSCDCSEGKAEARG